MLNRINHAFASIVAAAAMLLGFITPMSVAHADTLGSTEITSTGGTYVIAASAQPGSAIGQVTVRDPDPTTSPVFSLLMGDGLAIDSATGALQTSSSWVAGSTTKTIRGVVAVTDAGKTAISPFRVQALSADALAVHGLTMRQWNNVPGGDTGSLTSSAHFQDAPDAQTVQSQPMWYETALDNYGQRWTGYLVAPESGNYKFYISSDDSSQFRISTNADPKNLPRDPQAQLSGWGSVFGWGAGNTSGNIKLVKGQAYFVEILFKEAGGAAHMELGWKTPSGSEPVVPAKWSQGSAIPSFIVPQGVLLPESTLSKLQPPTIPGALTVESVKSGSVTLAWKNSTDDQAVANYLVTADGGSAVTVTEAATGGVSRYTLAATAGDHTYTVSAVDTLGNISDAATVKFTVAGDYDAIDAAMKTGNAAGITDAALVVARARQAIVDNRKATAAMYTQIYKNVSSVAYTPNVWDWLIAPTGAGASQTYSLLKPTSCGSTCPADMSLGAFGYAPKGSRFAAVNGDIITTTGYSAAAKNLLSWLVTGSSTSTPTTATKIAILEPQTGLVTAASLKTFITGAGWSNSTNTVVCTSLANWSKCAAGANFVILEPRGIADADAATITTMLQAYDTAGTPVLWADNLTYQNAPGNNQTAAQQSMAGYYNLTYNHLAYWDSPAASYATSGAVSGIGASGTTDEFTNLDIVLAHLQNQDWNVDFSACAESNCASSQTATDYLNSQFYAGADSYLKPRLNAFDNANFNIFSLPVSMYAPLRYSVLLGDVYRRDIRYPLNGADAKTSQVAFFQAMFADDSVFNSRPYDAQQTDLGTFSRTLSPTLTHYDDTLNFTTRTGDYFTAAGVYVFPGETVTISRTDSSSTPAQVFVNSLRWQSTKIFDNYSRPRYLQSAHISLVKGQPVTFTNPYGGPMQIWMGGTADAQTVSLDVKNVGHHPVWNGDATTAVFTKAMADADFDWAEFLTPGFQVHSRLSYLQTTLQDARWNTPAKLAKATMENFYEADYNLAGFTGPYLSLSDSLKTQCDAHGWLCTGRDPHGITSMNHFNSDQATCGYGCSGNPYDAWWNFSPLGWGDSHEMGHNIQRMHLVNTSNNVTTVEVSNNVYPSFVKVLWNQMYPSMLANDTGKFLDQDLLYKILNSAQTSNDPTTTVANTLWAPTDPTSYDGKTDINWGLFRLAFYWQLVAQSAHSSTAKFGQQGWDFITLMYMTDRLIRKYSGDATAWNTNKASLCMSNYTAAEANGIYSGLGYNDAFLIQASCVAQLDQRDLFKAWGIRFSDKASAQVAALNLKAAPKVFWVYSKDKNNTSLWSLPTTTSLPIDGTSRTLPFLAEAVAYTPGDVTTGAYGVHQTISAFVGGTGTVSFLANGTAIPNCQHLASTPDTTNWGGEDGQIYKNTASCDYVPTQTGLVAIQAVYDGKNTDGTNSVSAPWNLTIAASAEAPVLTSVSSNSVREGASVDINGSQLSGVTSVTFNGYNVPFTIGTGKLTLAMPTVSPDLVNGVFVVNTAKYTVFAPSSVTVFKAVTGVDIPAKFFLNVGMKATLSAVVSPSFATNKAVTWSSSNAAVASVDDKGVLRGVSLGNATITVTSVDGSKTDTMAVTVQAGTVVPVSFIDLSTRLVQVDAGSTATVTAKVVPATSTDGSVQWSSADSTIATVSDSGVITGVAPGTTVVTALNAASCVIESVVVNVTIPVSVDDTKNLAVGITTAMSFSLNAGHDWTAYNGTNLTAAMLAGSRAVLVKYTTGTPFTKQLVFTDANTAANPLAGVSSNVTYLSDMQETSASNGYGPTRYDQSTDTNNLSLKGVTYAKGLGLHAPATYTYAIPANASRFVAMVGVDDESKTNGTVTFEVLVDGVSKKLTSVLKGGGTPVKFDINAAGGKVLTLKVGQGTDGNGSDHSDWAGAQFVPLVSGVAVTPASNVIATGGATTQLAATVSADASVDTSVTWTSSDTSVATVSSTGLVTSVGAGVATITAVSKADASYKGTARIAVAAPRVNGLVLDATALNLALNSTAKIKATVSAETGADTTVSWTSSNPAVAKVGTDGTVTPVAKGTTVISATTAGGFEAFATVTVANLTTVTGVTLSTSAATLATGTTLKLVASVAPTGATNSSVTWTSSNVKVAKVDANGLVTPVAVGTVTITVTTIDGSFTATAAITVTKPVTGVKLAPATLALKVGATSTLKATVAPATGNQAVVWSSSNKSVATVDDSGVVTAVGAGTATITVTTVDGGFTATTAVTVTKPVTGVTLSASALTLKTGATGSLVATLAPIDASNQTVTWTTSSAKIATVDANGVVTAVGPGTATIKVTTKDGAFVATATVTVPKPVTGVKLGSATLAIKAGATATLKATVAPATATDPSVTWVSSDTKVVTVDSKGVVTAVAAGVATVTITTTDGGFTATVKVTVSK